MKVLFAFFIIMSSSAIYAKENVSPACSGKPYQAFNFWLGKWDVVGEKSKPNTPPAKSHITQIINGCVIFEEYSTSQGYVGKSLNMYDRQTGQWHQTWTDNSGLLLKLDGGMQGDSMVMMGTSKDKNGHLLSNRITWTPNAQDGTVRQLWEQSKDEGKTWTISFDGTYSRRVD